MFDRKEIKEKAKAAFKANYWKSVLVSFIMSAITGATVRTSGSTTANTANNAAGTENINELASNVQNDPKVLAIIIGAIVTIVLILVAVDLVLSAFLLNPIEMGSKSFFMKNSYNPETPLDEIERGFTPSYKRNVKTMFFRDILVFLWSLLLIVPGIIKSYAYSLVPYILAEDQDIEPKDALRKSEDMMKGHKWELFVLRLSFIGWDLLDILTLGLLNIFYTGPYYKAAMAEFYNVLKENV